MFPDEFSIGRFLSISLQKHECSVNLDSYMGIQVVEHT